MIVLGHIYIYDNANRIESFDYNSNILLDEIIIYGKNYNLDGVGNRETVVTDYEYNNPTVITSIQSVQQIIDNYNINNLKEVWIGTNLLFKNLLEQSRNVRIPAK